MPNTSIIHIRPYQDSDKAQLMELIQHHTPIHFSPSESEEFEIYLNEKRELYFVLTENASIIGCGGINFDQEENVAKISWDIIHPAHQGKSLGKKLLEYRLQVLKTYPVQKIIVRTSQTAYGFYQKNGFSLSYTEKDYWAPGFDLYYMEYTGIK